MTLKEAVESTMIKKHKEGRGLSDSQYQRFSDNISKKYGYTEEEIYAEYERQWEIGYRNGTF